MQDWRGLSAFSADYHCLVLSREGEVRGGIAVNVLRPLFRPLFTGFFVYTGRNAMDNILTFIAGMVALPALSSIAPSVFSKIFDLVFKRANQDFQARLEEKYKIRENYLTQQMSLFRDLSKYSAIALHNCNAMRPAAEKGWMMEYYLHAGRTVAVKSRIIELMQTYNLYVDDDLRSIMDKLLGLFSIFSGKSAPIEEQIPDEATISDDTKAELKSAEDELSRIEASLTQYFQAKIHV